MPNNQPSNLLPNYQPHTVPTLCRYFVANNCKYGDRCLFSHDLSATRHQAQQSEAQSNQPRQPQNVCFFWRSGNCTFGQRCRYAHTLGHEGPSAPVNANRNSSADAASSHSSTNTRLRADAPEFVPSQPSFHDASFDSVADVTELMSGLTSSLLDTSGGGEDGQQPSGSRYQMRQAKKKVQLKYDELCPYYVKGSCWYGADNCQFVHGQPCDFCSQPLLHPTDKKKRAAHIKECSDEFEKEMDQAFASAASERAKLISKEKTCGICMDKVVEKKETSEQRFGILPSCRHVFCLTCIRKWRGSRTFEANIVRSCPECRTKSDFVVPSSIWAEDEEEKQKLVDHYKKQCKQKHCKYFKRGAVSTSECPFGNQCFYRHEKPDGTLVVGDSPRTVRRRMQAQNGGTGRRRSFVMWDFLTVDDDWDDLEFSWSDAEADWDTASVMSLHSLELETDLDSIIDRMDWTALLNGHAAAMDLDLGYSHALGYDFDGDFDPDDSASSSDWQRAFAMIAATDRQPAGAANANADRQASGTNNSGGSRNQQQRGRTGNAGNGRNRRNSSSNTTTGAAAARTGRSEANNRRTNSTNAAAPSSSSSSNHVTAPWSADIAHWWNTETGFSTDSSSGDTPWSFAPTSSVQRGRSRSNGRRNNRQPRNVTRGGFTARQASNMTNRSAAAASGRGGGSNRWAASHSGTPSRSMSGRRASDQLAADAPDVFPADEFEGGLF